MKTLRITVKEWLESWEKGYFRSKGILAQISAGWYIFECEEKELSVKTERIAEKLKETVKKRGTRFAKTHSLFFKNEEGKDTICFINSKTGNIVERMPV